MSKMMKVELIVLVRRHKIVYVEVPDDFEEDEEREFETAEEENDYSEEVYNRCCTLCDDMTAFPENTYESGTYKDYDGTYYDLIEDYDFQFEVLPEPEKANVSADYVFDGAEIKKV